MKIAKAIKLLTTKQNIQNNVPNTSLNKPIQIANTINHPIISNIIML